VEASGGRLVVATGDGALGVRRLQLAGRGALTAGEFLNANKMLGAQLG
jgi:methionyl-tRNA formyltransferase